MQEGLSTLQLVLLLAVPALTVLSLLSIWTGDLPCIWRLIATLCLAPTVALQLCIFLAFQLDSEKSHSYSSNVELTGAARLYRAASSDRRERG